MSACWAVRGAAALAAVVLLAAPLQAVVTYTETFESGFGRLDTKPPATSYTFVGLDTLGNAYAADGADLEVDVYRGTGYNAARVDDSQVISPATDGTVTLGVLLGFDATTDDMSIGLVAYHDPVPTTALGALYKGAVYIPNNDTTGASAQLQFINEGSSADRWTKTLAIPGGITFGTEYYLEMILAPGQTTVNLFATANGVKTGPVLATLDDLTIPQGTRRTSGLVGIGRWRSDYSNSTSGGWIDNFQVVPEPATMLGLLAGLCVVSLRNRKHR